MGLNGGPFKTSDMALAVTILLDGHSYELEQGVGPVRGYVQKLVYWVFPATEAVLKLAAEYAAGEAIVEPQVFVKTWGVVRQEMLGLLND